MLTYDLSNKTGPLYVYLYQSLKKDISEGRILPGTKLPSKRTFANNLGVSTITIENAYGQL
ncbi:regulatory protein, gntR family [Eubacterium ruminantium]|uniref:Regulatory protein, gntR family n=1 Tax=Eubacterium ruminantium TaxID=42322 RepID=A0A1T4MVC7_9FIRM|nr:regulatory protein, gntR family [Eubacterium ruminantium]SDM70712.1 regulatory protein, gntR family [Eubacterium ruminantium]SJZ70794.1 regulatory protein, gntR family [Eubacterium ruminantium]